MNPVSGPSPEPVGPGRALRWAVLAFVVALGSGLAGWTAVALREQGRERGRLAHAAAARERVELLRSQVLRSTEILNSITAFFQASQEVTRVEFRRFVESALRRQPELQALEWIPRVPGDQRVAYEQAAVADGLEGFVFNELTSDDRLVPASLRDEYYPVFYVEPVRGNARALGLDLGHHPYRRKALENAWRTGRPTATAPIRLAQGGDDRPGFLVFAAVPDHAGAPRGFGLAVFRVDRLIEASLAPLVARGLYLDVRDEGVPEGVLYAAGEPDGRQPPAWTHVETLEIGGRRWRVTVTPGTHLPPAALGLQVWAVPAGILAVTGLLAGYLLAGMRRTDEIERKVREKTAQLSTEITERQRAESLAREAEKRYRSIFENAIDGIFQSTREGRYLRANAALARIYGYDSPEELLVACSDIGRQLYVDPTRRAEFVRLIETHGSVADFVSQVRRRDGSIITISEKAIAVRDPDGHVLYFEGIVEDVSERVRTADQLQRANEILEQRVTERTVQLAEANAALTKEIEVRKRAEEAAESANRAKSLFLADMSHELRTPLNAVLGYTQLLQMEPGLSAAQSHALKSIVAGGNHLLCLVDGVLDLTKIEVGRMDLEPVEFDLNVLIGGLEAMFVQRTRQKGLLFRVERASMDPLWLRGDEGKLRQVLINLLSNAVKFTESGEVILRIVPAAQVGYYRFEVIDSGPGIPVVAQALIFEPFNQAGEGRSKGGTGLGLSISRRLVSLMGGRLAVNSSPGWGSNFFFTLPFEPIASVEALAEDPTLTLPCVAPGERLRVLVLDDLAPNREILATFLGHFGCEVTSAATIEEASAAIAKVTPDLVFVDLRLEGHDGVEWVRRVRGVDTAASTRFVSYSASAFAHDRARCTAAGFDGFLSKPVQLSDLSHCLLTLFAARLVSPAPVAAPGTAGPSAPLVPKAIPSALLTQLRSAADIGDCATLRRLLAEFDALPGPAVDGWKLRLTQLVERFDTDGITELLKDPSSVPATSA
jgi:PAS domain S-box-containing protein